MTKDTSFCYGIIFYFITIQIYNIVCDLISSLLLGFNEKIIFIPISLILVVVCFLLCFIKMNKFRDIKIWKILLVVLLSFILKFFNLPGRYYMTTSSFYTIEQQSIITLLIFSSKALINIGIIVIAYFQYVRIKK